MVVLTSYLSVDISFSLTKHIPINPNREKMTGEIKATKYPWVKWSVVCWKYPKMVPNIVGNKTALKNPPVFATPDTTPES
jgi:hypothetical protein